MLIGLTGPAGVGKDTVASLLMEQEKFYRYAFAGPLKQALSVLGIEEPKRREDKEFLIPGRRYSYRTAAQTLGTEWARRLSDSFWIDLAKQKLEECTESYAVITDVRFENEAAFIRKYGGVVWHIVGRESTVQGHNATHASEAGIEFHPNKDYIVRNEGTIEELKLNVFEVFHETCSRFEFNSLAVSSSWKRPQGTRSNK